MTGVLFDLDGTLADTALDLGYVLNILRERHGLPPLPAAVIRPYASHGTPGLLHIGFGLSPQDAPFAALRADFLDLYQRHLSTHTRLFPGIDALLQELDARGLPWGVVTNKPERFTLPLMEQLGLMKRAASIVGGDTCAHAKPHPEPMLHACRELNVAPENCLYLGDAERDVAAARAANMRALIAAYGYLGADDEPDTWNADGSIDHPAQLLA
ncbi:MAG: HAD-IA family hydrolase, partial [Sulfuricellaceae bacterium]|nr:HAD-IA family hydrolase [Sulfuricellaceae bacterium]